MSEFSVLSPCPLFRTGKGEPDQTVFGGINLILKGEVVGFDVGWTSKGLRVTTIRPRAASSS